jgi:hypothetical protein
MIRTPTERAGASLSGEDARSPPIKGGSPREQS